MNIHHLRAAGTSLILDAQGPRLPRILHWGADLGDLETDALAEFCRTSTLPVISGTPDTAYVLSILPERAFGWMATPGMSGHRAGADFSSAFVLTRTTVTRDLVLEGVPVAAQAVVEADDPDLGLSLTWTLQLMRDGLIRIRSTLTNTGVEVFDLGSLDQVLPLPGEAREILDFTGRHLKERSPQRHPLVAGTHLRETRRARSHDGTLLLLVGGPGFTYSSGEVWGLHVGWSGNVRTFAEKEMPSGQATIGGGELLLAGEVRIASGESYTTPWVYAAYGRGLDELSSRFHRFLRSRPEHPSTARKSLINVWEAVYFDHRLDRLQALADVAAAVGLERFVLDDGWFRHRRDDTAGLGDWYVDESVWPDGLDPLIDHVTGLGLDFGLWFEPEMVNEDSDLARAHPEWILRTPYRMPGPSRNQQVLDLTIPSAWSHIYERIDELLTRYRISFVKWDHNRDLVDPGRQSTGSAGVHLQTAATYRLITALRKAHPTVEFESCAGGGGRSDLGILSVTDRVWTSDCIDPLERQGIEASTGLLLPPELMGSHIASPHSQTTGRRHDLSFRAATALFGHLGVEWDLTTASPDELSELTTWIAAYREHRDLLHHGRVVRADTVDASLRVHGVVSEDRSEAIFAIVQLTASVSSPPGRVRLPGLDEQTVYRVAPLAPSGGHIIAWTRAYQPVWWPEGTTATGRLLSVSGIQCPVQLPEHSLLLHVCDVGKKPSEALRSRPSAS